MNLLSRLLAAGLGLMSLVACARSPQPDDAASVNAATVAAAAADSTAATSSASRTVDPDEVSTGPDGLPTVVVHKSPSCGCCGKWVEHMRAQGFDVQVNDVEELGLIKSRVGVPAGVESCHTAEVDGYFVEGHVPADDIKRLLRERPDVRGLALPGMPLGSPGMEHPSGRTQPYVVVAVQKNGATREFARHGD